MVLIALSAVLSLGLAACGGSSDKSTDTAAAKPAAATPTGTPIKVMNWAPEGTPVSAEPDIPATLKVAVADINAKGGINGHPVQLITCNSKLDPNEEQKCARQAVSEKVAAVLSPFGVAGQATYPILEAAKIPAIGPSCCSPQDTTSKVSFPFANSTILGYAAIGVAAPANGCKSVSVVQSDFQAADFTTQLVKNGLKPAGQSVVGVSRVSTPPGDLTATVAASTSKADCVSLAISDNVIKQYAVGLAQSGKKPRLLFAQGVTSQATVDDTGGASSPFEGAIVPGPFPAVSDAAWKPMRDAIAAYAGSTKIDLNNSATQTAWTSMQIFIKAATGITGDVTADKVLAALNATSALDTGGLLPTLDFTKDFAMPGFNRLTNRMVWYQTVKDGKFVDLKQGFSDITPMLTGSG
jgi:ABC-type branched-subunit amino acid transport system substrate-binding protein